MYGPLNTPAKTGIASARLAFARRITIAVLKNVPTKIAIEIRVYTSECDSNPTHSISATIILVKITFRIMMEIEMA